MQETRFGSGKAPRLEYLPDHVIPHENCEISDNRCAWRWAGAVAGSVWDALAAGRIAHGERWNFHEVDSHDRDFPVRRGFVFLNRTRIRPPALDPGRLGLAQEFNYLAMLVIVADGCETGRKPLQRWARSLEIFLDAYGGVSALASSGCVVKLLARSASDLLSAQAWLWGRARQIILGSPAIDLRKY